MAGALRVSVAVLAGGMGVRAGGNLPKPFRAVLGKPLILHALEAFDAMPEVLTLRVAVPAEHRPTLNEIMDLHPLRVYRGCVQGGITRARSALAVLRALEGDRPDVVLVHDAARPIVSAEETRALLEALPGHQGAILAARAVDTLWRVSEDGRLEEVADRRSLVRALTPQAFPYEVLREAYERGVEEGFEGTDDASYVRHAGGDVVWVTGTSKNIKVTYEEDFALLEALLLGGRP
ncbi:MAG: 2-C-methyl-D-erythritol 4-phosphate cytidylyltransferase [Acidobacteriota bacterium]